MAAKRRDSSLSSLEGELRLQAENRLEKVKPKTLANLDASLEELVRELEVHQAELAVQNEELQQAQLELAQSRDRYQELYDTAPNGYFTLDDKYQILEVNLSGAELLSTSRQMVLKARFSSFITPTQENQNVFYLHLRKVAQTRQLDICELELHRQDGTAFYAQLSSLPVKNKEKKQTEYRIAVTDITARKEIEDKIRQSEEKFRHLFETMAQGVIYQDSNGHITAANMAAEQILGFSLEQLQERHPDQPHGRAIREDGSEFSNNQHPSAIALKTGQPVRNMVMGFFNPRENRIRWANVCAIPYFKLGETVAFQTYIILSDITELKRIQDELEKRVQERTAEIVRAHEKLKTYARQIVRVQEAERKQIAYELHDDTVQYLSILKLQIESILESGKIRDSDIQDKLGHLKDDAQRAMLDIRRYSHELRPAVLDHAGLAAALEQLAQDIREMGTMKIELKIDGEEKGLSDEIRLALFRITQEALNNARKHAAATAVEINLSFSPEFISLIINDNGKGFNIRKETTQAIKRGSLGLLSMQERAELISADLKIESEPGKGTRVGVELRV
jgi:PAS domain S-box-containing protein